MPHDNDRAWTSPSGYKFENYGNPPSAANFFAEMAQESSSASYTARNSATHDHWGTVMNAEPERAPATGRTTMSSAGSRPLYRRERTSTNSANGNTLPSSQPSASSQRTEQKTMADPDDDFTPRFPIAPPPREEPPTPVPSTVHSPAGMRPAPGLERLADNLNALRTFGASRTDGEHRLIHQVDSKKVENEQKSSFRPMIMAKAATIQPSTGPHSDFEVRDRGDWSMPAAFAASPPTGQAPASNRFRFNPNAEFRPRFNLPQTKEEPCNLVNGRSASNEAPHLQAQQGYAAADSRPTYEKAGTRSMSGTWNSGIYDLDLASTLRQGPSIFGAREVDDLTNNFGGVSLSASTTLNRTTTASTTPPTTATSRGSSGTNGSGGPRLPAGWSTWSAYNTGPMTPQQSSFNGHNAAAGNALGDSSPDSDAHVPDHVFHDFAARLRARAHPNSLPQQQSAQAGYGQDARDAAMTQDYGRGPSYRFKDFANPQLDGPLYTAQSVYIVVEFKLHRAELFQMAPEWGMGDLLSRSDLFVKVEADRGYDVGLVVMASGDLEEARDDRQARYKRHWNSLVDFSARPHWRSQGEKLRKENFDGYYNHMSAQPLTNQYKGGARPPGIVCTVAPWVVEDLRFKEAGEMKAKRRCAEAAASIANLDCEVVGAEYQLDCQKLTVFYISDSYIDYKELSHNLYRTFKTRLWFVALNPASFYPPTRAPGYDHRLVAHQPTQRPLQPGDSQFYAAPSLGSPSSLPFPSVFARSNSIGLNNSPGLQDNGFGCTAPSYRSQSDLHGNSSFPPSSYRGTSFSNGSSRPQQPMSPVGYGSSSSYSSMAPAYDGVSSFRATSEPRFLTNGSGLSIHNNASGTASSRSVSFGQGASSSSGNGVSTPFTNSRTSSFGNGVSLPFGHDAFSSFAHNNLPGLSNVSQFGYTSFSATPHASYQQSRLQGEHPGGTRDFGPIGPRNRQ